MGTAETNAMVKEGRRGRRDDVWGEGGPVVQGISRSGAEGGAGWQSTGSVGREEVRGDARQVGTCP